MMNDNLNKTAICSVLALEIIDFAKKTQDEQIKIKSLFNSFINQAVIDIPEADRIIVDTINGAAITCKGPLEDALEDALFISITIRDEILKNNAQSFNPLYVQFGINLGPARVTNNAGMQTNITGDGIDVAQRIKSFANPNQILVSQVYFEMASKLTQEMAQMFEKYDMHAYEQDVYAVRLLKGGADAGDAATLADAIAPAQAVSSNINWLYMGAGLLTFAAFFALIKLVSAPTEPTITIVQPAQIQPMPIKPAAIKPAAIEEQTAITETAAEPNAEPVIAAKPASTSAVNSEPKKASITQKKPQQNANIQTKDDTKAAEAKTEKPAANTNDNKAPANTAAKPADAKADKNAGNEKSGWKTFTDSVKSGTDRKCTQAEIALNQCNK